MHLVVIPAVVVKIPGKSDDLITSQRRKFWPAAYRTVLDVYSDSAIVSWPPACSYMTNQWNLEACPIVTSGTYHQPDTESRDSLRKDKPEYSCINLDLSAESAVHIANLLPCKLYQFRLKALYGLLWTFAPSRTLPTPQVDAKSSTNSIQLTITQNGDCDERALVHHWRVLYCEHEDDEHDNEIFLGNNNKIEKDLFRMKADSSNKRHLFDVDGSGAAISDDEDNIVGGMEYYEDNNYVEVGIHPRTSPISSCRSHLYDISSSKGKIKIDHLKECTLYTVDVSPVDASGHTMQPSEQFGSVHSTLCPVGVATIPSSNENDQESNSFWFNDQSSPSHAQGMNNIYIYGEILQIKDFMSYKVL